MNLLIICPHYAPDVAPTGEVMTAITEALAARGHRIHIVTSLPWYRLHEIEPEWRGRAVQTEATEWGWITRLNPFPTDKTNIAARAAGFVGFTGAATIASAVSRFGPDAVMVMSPPLPLGVSGWLAARLRGVPWVFNIQDVFPDVAVELGAITDKRVIAVASWLERFLYRRSNAVTVLSDDLADNIENKLAGHRPERVRVIPNFVDTDRVRPHSRDTSYRTEYRLGDHTVVMYAGNVGMSQSLDLVVEAARRFAGRPDVLFVINGGGSAQADLMASAEGLENIRFIEMQPRERLGEVLASGDIHVIPLRTGLARSSVPSKLYSILAAARPVVASVDVGTEVARTIESAGAGLAVQPEDPDAFCDALARLLDDPAGRERMGASGRHFVEEWVSPAAVAAAYERLFEDVRAERFSRRG
ncbi:MAG: glycosyltransferase family 4 protein [Actinomycetia bacterium]|nr:glycosyltransferase family 4 protein [Actinomycetes bacterium]